MGVDCYLYDNKEYHRLDRWYVFSDLFESGRKYSTKEAIKILKPRLKGSMPKWTGDWKKDEMRKNYFNYWASMANEIIKKTNEITFYSENDVPDEYYGIDNV